MKRLLWADSLKGILIMLVVLGHAIQESLLANCFDNHLWNYIYSFHMPAFIAVSGFLNYRGGGDGKYFQVMKRRFEQLMIPFFCWALIKILISPPYHITDFVNAILYPDGSFWFLWVLFFISVFFIFGDWIAENLRVKTEIIIASLATVFVLLMVFADIRILGFQFIAYYFLFYSIGYYLHKYDKLFTSKFWVLAVLTIAWLFLAYFWHMHKLPAFLASMPIPKTILNYFYRFITAIIAIYVILCMAPKLLNNDSKWNKQIISMGKMSLGIYTTHILIISFIVKYLTKDGGLSLFLTIIIAFIVTLTMAWLTTWLLSKNKFTNRLLLGKTKQNG